MKSILIAAIILIILEIYVYRGVNSLFANTSMKRTMFYFALSSFLLLIGFLTMAFQSRHGISEMSYPTTIFWGLAFSIIIGRILFIFGLLTEDIYRIIRWICESIFSQSFAAYVFRSKVYLTTIFSLCTVASLLFLYGVLFGKYNYKVHEHDVHFKNLPKEFDGFKVAQITDLHLGTFHDIDKVNDGLKLLQEQKPDIIVFTGDMVNNRAEEAKKFINIFQKLEAPYGKYSVLGNHDYGHYVRDTSFTTEQNLISLTKYQNAMGFELLKNEHRKIKRGDSHIILAGVENWGKRPFPQLGDLKSTLMNVTDNDFVVLLSHDPTHWTEKVLNFSKNIDLTLSGHTHGMQFGIEMFGKKWSPVKYVYKNWAGLYSEGSKYLYVSRGFGHIGYPGRVGIWPEITILNLRRAK